ncbi:MAG: nucleotidyltransferase domain-containing protein [Deltaproteobacteria bacterium]|nr:nucleotidyltransferase domain-containing protein [Deltaproteobacteria bacterium]
MDILKHEERLRSLYQSNSSAKEILIKRSNFYDKLIEELLRKPIHPISLEDISIIATGSYGRQEMNRYSDLDLQILHKGLRQDVFPKLDKTFLKPLLDKKINIAIMNRDISKPIKTWNFNLHEQTVFFETRFICGSKQIYKEWKSLLNSHFAANNNRMKLLKDVIADYDKFLNDLPDNKNEPNLKKGRGGLREYSFFTWITAISGKKPENMLNPTEKVYIKKAVDFLWLVRDSIHFMSGFRQDILTKELQDKFPPEMNILQTCIRHTENLHKLFYAKNRLMECNESATARTPS